MENIPAIAIFDVGKTNKKFFLFDQDYAVIFEDTIQLTETQDEDGFPCEDVLALTKWIQQSFARACANPQFKICAVNFSGYGASLVYLDSAQNVIPPLYNYLKPYPQPLLKKFYARYGGQRAFSRITASPVLGNLNSGMQLYWLKYEKPAIFERLKYALHLPQYLSFVLTSALHSDITSIGCHTNLWNFQENKYHNWVAAESIKEKFPGIVSCNAIAGHVHKNIPAGAGLHDTSAALVPYLTSFQEPFALLSTGTWCISLNPFNHSLLLDDELRQDCLCYLSHKGKPIKASRLFAGHEHEQQVKRLAAHFTVDVEQYKAVKIDFDLLTSMKSREEGHHSDPVSRDGTSLFAKRQLNEFSSYDHAYHRLIADIIGQQVRSTHLVLRETSVKRLFVDGGFSNNSIYMHMLANAFSNIEVYAATVPQASALGAALVFHENWNRKIIRPDLIKFKLYSGRNINLKEGI